MSRETSHVAEVAGFEDETARIVGVLGQGFDVGSVLFGLCGRLVALESAFLEEMLDPCQVFLKRRWIELGPFPLRRRNIRRTEKIGVRDHIRQLALTAPGGSSRWRSNHGQCILRRRWRATPGRARWPTGSPRSHRPLSIRGGRFCLNDLGKIRYLSDICIRSLQASPSRTWRHFKKVLFSFVDLSQVRQQPAASSTQSSYRLGLGLSLLSSSLSPSIFALFLFQQQ